MTNNPESTAEANRRLLLLAGKLGYQTRSFANAARRAGAEILLGTDRCHQLEDPWADGALPLHFEDADWAARSILEAAKDRPIHGILALGDRTAETAARVAAAISVPYNSLESVRICRSKLQQREVFQKAKIPVPEFFPVALVEPMDRILRHMEYPAVVKPISLAASQGVIRVNNAEEFIRAIARDRSLLESPELKVTRELELHRLLVERYIPGGEVAVEALLTHGKLRVLAIFDKPDPLEGPYFEETIYVTPSRLQVRVQRKIEETLLEAVKALGLTEGPIHAEFRIHEETREPWILEVAPRPIGGLCADALRFGEERISLEELLVRHALRFPGSDLTREKLAAGVMMIPVPASGVLEAVDDVEKARQVPGIESVEITARLHDSIRAWPEGSSYLGFIFSRAETPAKAEKALRRAHVLLRIRIGQSLPVEHPATRKLPPPTRAAPQS